MRHLLIHGVTLALVLAAMPSVAAAQQRAEPSASTPPTPGGLPPPVLGQEALWGSGSIPPGSIPPGYVLRTKPRTTFVIGGVLTLLGMYLPVAVGGAAEGDWSLALPVVGPLVVGGGLLDGTSPRPCGATLCLRLFDELAGVVLIATGIVQAAGIAMLVYGLVSSQQVVRYEPLRAGFRWTMSPGAAGTPLGLTLSLTTL